MCHISIISYKNEPEWHWCIPACFACVIRHLAVDEGDAVAVAGQVAHRLGAVLAQRAAVPHLTERVVAP